MESIAPGESIGMGISAEQLAEEIGLDAEEIAWRKEFLNFTSEDEQRLASMSAVVESKEAELVEAFLEPILSDARTREIVGRSPRTNDQLEAIVSGYLKMFTGGTYDQQYYTHRCRIGRLHDRLDMPLHYFGGMFGNFLNILLDEIESLTVESATESLSAEDAADVEASIGEGFANARAAVRGANLDMQVVNDTYLHSYSREMREEIDKSREMREGVDTIDTLAAEQTANTEELADGLSDLSASVEEVAATADEVSATSTRAEEMAEEGHEAAANAAETMARVDDARGDITERVDTLVDTIDEIDEIVEVINGIAEQTNLLALNASIEAARAGEAGSGFAVVADEVKALANESKEQAERVEGMIDEVTDHIDETAVSLDDADDHIRRGIDEVEESMTRLERIRDAVEEASSGIGEVARATDDQAETSAQLAQRVDDTADRADEVAAELDELLESVRSQSDTATEIDEALDELESVEAAAGDTGARARTQATTDGGTASTPGRGGGGSSGFEWSPEPTADDGGESAATGDDGLPAGMPDFVKEMLDEETKAQIRRGELDRPEWTK
jgi:methyl-accepting chemotaxis protein